MEQVYLKTFASLFVGRDDDYAVQTEEGRYRRVGQALNYERLLAHLRGKVTLGTYVLAEEGTCRFAVFDADSADGLSVLADLSARLDADGIPSLLECSRRGGHLWVLFSTPLPAWQVRRWLLPYCPAEVEFYPKQDSTEHYGSLIRMPLGVHRLSGECYGFLTWNGAEWVSAGSSLPELLTWLAAARRAVPPDFVHAWENTTTVATHNTSMTKSVPSSFTGGPMTTVTPMSPSITDWCAAQDVFSLIGRYVALDARGMGCCPFGWHHDDGVDSHPSFRVFVPSTPGGQCWHCYTWGRGGSVFDFLAFYYGLDARSLWSRLMSGEQF